MAIKFSPDERERIREQFSIGGFSMHELAIHYKCNTSTISRICKGVKRIDPIKPNVLFEPNPGPQTQFFESNAFEVLYGGAAGGGKDLSITTPIPTPTGWSTMGALRAGDFVFDPNGVPSKVLAISDTFLNHDCYELTFSDGSKIVAGKDHLWVTSNIREREKAYKCTDEYRAKRRATRPKRGKGLRPDLAEKNAEPKKLSDPVLSSVRTTKEIFDTLYDEQRVNHSIPVAQPVQYPPKELLIDPYLLGCWLGDGTSKAGVITTADADVIGAFQLGGYEIKKYAYRYSWGVNGFIGHIRKLGLYGNKHIPEPYLRGSVEQRLALLQGLMDTDGFASKDNGHCEFTTTFPALRDGFYELLCSLGIKVVCREGRSTFDGVDKGPKWVFKFLTELPAFRLPRKLNRQKRNGFRGTHNKRYIVSCVQIPSVPTKCIRVDSPSHCYLVGRAMIPTHNSTALLMAPLAQDRYKQKGFRALILRRTYPELNRSLIPKSHEYYKPLGAVYDQTKHIWTFPSGAIVEFGHCETENEIRRYQSAEYQVICFDELTQFTEYQYTYAFSRLRSADGIACRVRAATNPGGDGHEWVFKRFAPWLDPKSDVKAKEGQILYYGVDENESVIVDKKPFKGALSRQFIPAKLSDNPYLTEKDSTYASVLRQMDPVSREQLLHGNWLIKPAAGLLFKRSYFDVVGVAPSNARRVRYWDRAAGVKTTSDWTVGLKLARLNDVYYVEHVIRFRGHPSEVERIIKQTAEMDGADCEIAIEQDPAQAGKFEADYYVRALAGFNVRIYQTGNKKKLSRAEPVSAQAAAHNIKMVNGSWNEEFLSELEQFPDGRHDDQVDALSGAFAALVKHNFVPWREYDDIEMPKRRC